MKKIIILITLLVQFNLFVEAQPPIRIVHFSDTIKESDTLSFVTSSVVIDNVEPFTGCSPLIRYSDSLQMNYLVYDLVFDFTGPFIQSCIRKDTFSYVNLLQGNYSLVCHHNWVDSTGSPPKKGVRVGSDTVSFYVKTVTGIKENSLDKITIAPNPVKDVLFLNDLDNEEYSYEIWDAQGKLIELGRLRGSKLNLSALKAGLYIFRLKNKNGESEQKFIKN
ncbi:MAG: T9SS type A sorting domain-containing protein [Vicingaceae bacterium]